MASIQARHQRDCAFFPWAPLDPETLTEAKYKKTVAYTKREIPYATYLRRVCSCSPSPLYHAVFWHDRKLVRQALGHNKKEALRAFRALDGDLARKKYRPLEDVRFADWGQQWLAGCTVKENTARIYRVTIEYATETFGRKNVRDLTAADVRAFLVTVDRRSPRGGAQPATLAKHLRHLTTCLEAAVGEGYAAENPAKRLHSSQRPKAPKLAAVYFTADELPRLWPELAGRPVYLSLCKTAASTGMRLGELLALRWSDVDLLNREVTVSRTFVAGLGEQATTKTSKGRVVDLVPAAASVLEEWLPQTSGEGLVFERESAGHIDPSYVTRRVLYPALRRAGIAREGEHGRKRDFHSFRHSFAKIALEHGAAIQWVSGQLGHSSIQLTINSYGSWERATEKRQALALDGAFSV